MVNGVSVEGYQSKDNMGHSSAHKTEKESTIVMHGMVHINHPHIHNFRFHLLRFSHVFVSQCHCSHNLEQGSEMLLNFVYC